MSVYVYVLVRETERGGEGRGGKEEKGGRDRETDLFPNVHIL